MESPSVEVAKTVISLQLQAWPVWIGAALILAGALAAMRFPRARFWVASAALLGALGYGGWRAWQTKWLCDDAWISFTYARHWADGLGLVLNPGERVEGYTNFLWTIVLGIFAKFGASIPHVALFGGLVCWVGLVLGVARLTRSVRMPSAGLPLAAIAVAVMRPFTNFATSGLETAFALGLCVWAVVAWREEKPIISGVLFALGAMARPDYLLLAGATWAVAALELWLMPRSQRARVAAMARLIGPTIVIFCLYWALRWSWYGEFVPNTFLAKSGGAAYWSQGWLYAAHGFLGSAVIFSLPFVVAGLLLCWRSASRRPLVLLGIAVTLMHGLYVTRIGGDFMEYRFLLPSFLFLLVAWEAVCTRWLHEVFSEVRPAMAVGLLVCLAWAALALNVKPIAPFEKKWNLAAEESFYSVTKVWPEIVVDSNLSRLGHLLGKELAALKPTPRVATGCIGMVGYYSTVELIDTYGLANRTVARQPLTSRGRPGHERHASLESLIAERADFSDDPVWPSRNEDTKITIGGTPFYLVHHSPALQALAAQKGWSYPDPMVLALRDVDAPSREQLLDHRDFYAQFLRGTDLAQPVLKLFDRRLRGEDLRLEDLPGTPASMVARRLRQAEGLGLAPLVEAFKTRIVFRRDFESDDPPPDLVTGEAWPPHEGAYSDQGAVHGLQGKKLINTYRSQDRGTGRLEWKLPAGQGLVLDLLVGGGKDCSAVYAALFDGEREVARWCGQDDETLRAVSRPLDGLTAPRLVVNDASSAGWGHLLVDDLIVSAPQSLP